MTRTLRPAYPCWAAWPATAFVAVLVPVYWQHYGPSNFLWFSDIALFAVLVTLWTGTRLLPSMMAVGVLPMEISWVLDLVTGGTLLGLSAYMFDQTLPLFLRLLSLFHLAIPPLLIWMLIRHGYDRRAVLAQTLLAWIVLPASWLLGTPQDNINWVYGPGESPQALIPPLAYLGLYMALLPVALYLPMHALLKRLFGPQAG